jgi:succinate dehydrogenase / fumarate reductase cytochrome b subunit
MSHPSSRNALRWFDPRGRKVGSWAFILNRLAALALTFYLGLHLVVLNKLTQSAQAYNDFVAFAQIPFIKAGEIILISAVILHGLNGVRLTMLAFSIGLRHQKILFIFSAMTTILIVAMFVIRLFNK